MTKTNFCRALKDLINSNIIKSQTTGWVERESNEKKMKIFKLIKMKSLFFKGRRQF